MWYVKGPIDYQWNLLEFYFIFWQENEILAIFLNCNSLQVDREISIFHIVLQKNIYFMKIFVISMNYFELEWGEEGKWDDFKMLSFKNYLEGKNS